MPTMLLIEKSLIEKFLTCTRICHNVTFITGSKFFVLELKTTHNNIYKNFVVLKRPIVLNKDALINAYLLEAFVSLLSFPYQLCQISTIKISFFHQKALASRRFIDFEQY